jgi:hypothetical protein
MPLTPKGEKILSAMEEQYGKEKGKQVLYAAKNKGTISGIDAVPRALEEDCADQSPHELGPEHPQLQRLAENCDGPLGEMGKALEPDPDSIARTPSVHDDPPLAPLVMKGDPDPGEQGLEHPQLHPDSSTPPSSADQTHRSTYGSITGGINPFGVFGNTAVRVWGDQRDQAVPSPRAELASPGLTLAQIQKDNEQFWKPHGVAPGPFRDRRDRR